MYIYIIKNLKVFPIEALVMWPIGPSPVKTCDHFRSNTWATADARE